MHHFKHLVSRPLKLPGCTAISCKHMQLFFLIHSNFLIRVAKKQTTKKHRPFIEEMQSWQYKNFPFIITTIIHTLTYIHTSCHCLIHLPSCIFFFIITNCKSLKVFLIFLFFFKITYPQHPTFPPSRKRINSGGSLMRNLEWACDG